MAKRCEVCRGQRYIRLPIYRETAILSDPFEAPISCEASYKQYPCPECSISAPVERVHLIEAHVRVVLHKGMPVYGIEHAKRTAAYMLIDQLERSGAILFRRGTETAEDRAYEVAAPLIATLAVASTADAVRIEDRIKADREPYARAIVEEACAQIDNWGSDYSFTIMEKSDARTSVYAALDIVQKRFERKPA